MKITTEAKDVGMRIENEKSFLFAFSFTVRGGGIMKIMRIIGETKWKMKHSQNFY
jgi:hypothetical protein